MSPIKAVLFDLDGTFADTAPDLCGALNIMRDTRGLPPVPAEATRPVTSTGARGLLNVGFGMMPDHPEYLTLRTEFLDLYERNLCVRTQLFPGIELLIDQLGERNVKWGIVTNKAERFAIPLMHALKVADRCACIIGGDTTPFLKPNPAPLHEAARVIGIDPGAAIYVGDDHRDVQAGHAAGMKTIAVRYGYLNGSNPDEWGADAVVDRPEDVLALL